MSVPPAGRDGASKRPFALKVCCIQDEAELGLAADAGADFAGLVGAMPSGPGPIDDARIARLAAAAKRIRPVLLTARTRADEIAEHVRATGVRAVQIVRPVGNEVRRALRRALPGVTLFQVVHVEGPLSVDQAVEAAEEADFLLLDSGRPSAAVAELGGTGRVHDWALSARIVDAVRVPVVPGRGTPPGQRRRGRALRPPLGRGRVLRAA